MTCKVKLCKLFIYYNDRHPREDYVRVHMTSQPVYSEYRARWTVRVNLRLYLVHSHRHLPCAGFRKWVNLSLWISKKSSFTNNFLLLYTEESSPQVTSRTVNRQTLLLKKKTKPNTNKKKFGLRFHVSSNCCCPLSLVMLDYSVLCSQGKIQIHS